MYFVLYDRHLKSIGETYILETWSRVRRAIDFDTVSLIGEMIPYSAEPFFVVINDNRGHSLFSGLASIPIIDEKYRKTRLTLKDYATLFNTEIIVDWSRLLARPSLSDYISALLALWHSQTDIGFDGIEWDVSELDDMIWSEDFPLGTGVESVFLYDLIESAMVFYGITCDPFLDVSRKKLVFNFKKARCMPSIIKIKEFDTQNFEKSFGQFNRANIYSSGYELSSQWAITEDNQVVKLPHEGVNLLYPAKSRNFIAEKPSDELTTEQSLWNATYKGVMALSENRFQESLTLDVKRYAPYMDISYLDFSHLVTVYTPEGIYKDLPVGEIETNSQGSHIIRLGYQTQEFTQEI